jgi:hypothetical protein
MGVDLAFGVGEKHDSNSLSTWEFLEDGSAKLLDILTLQCANATFMRDIVYKKAIAFNDCHIVVESVGAQRMMVDMLKEKDKGLKIRSFNTSGVGTTNKWDQVTGVESMFVMIMNAAWILPCRPGQRVHDEIRKLIEACIYYLPSGHTADELMSTWFAMWWGRKLHVYRTMEKDQGGTLSGIGTR